MYNIEEVTVKLDKFQAGVPAHRAADVWKNSKKTEGLQYDQCK